MCTLRKSSTLLPPFFFFFLTIYVKHIFQSDNITGPPQALPLKNVSLYHMKCKLASSQGGYIKLLEWTECPASEAAAILQGAESTPVATVLTQCVHE